MVLNDDPLLQPYRFKHLELRNRIFSSAHEPAYSEDGLPKDRYRLYHVEKAKGGIALTMTAGTAIVAEDSPPAFGNLHAYRDEIVPWIRRLTDDVHEHGAACMIQISHLGRRTSYAQADWLPVVAPSALREPAHRTIPKAAEDWDVERIVRKYADAAERMQAGGMDGIEIEAYGHLFDQFWSPITNHRDDAYGTDLDGRMRFGLEVLRAIRDRVGDEFVVGLRMAIDERLEGGVDTSLGLEMLRRVEDLGLIDFVNVIRGNVADEVALTEVIPIHGMPSAPHLDFAGRVREATELTVLHASKVDDVASARHAIREGKVDLVGMTRAHLADPHIVRKIVSGQEDRIRPCVGATYCLDRIYEGGEALCLHNAATSREATMPHDVPAAARRRRIVVVGAGPGGLEAARVAGERGHDVVVLEAMPWAGGQLNLAVRNPRRRDLQGIIDWRLAECARLGVEIRLDTFADAEIVASLAPDAVIVATGGQPQLPPDIEGDTDRMSTSWDVLGGQVVPSGEVLFYDDNGTHSALSAAEMIARSGASLEIVTPERTFGIEVGGMNHVPYARAFNDHGTRITLHQRVVAVHAEGARLRVELGSDHSSRRDVRVVDHLVVDHGTAALDDLYFDLRPRSTNLGAVDHGALMEGRPQELVRNADGTFQLFRIGDAVASRNIHAAIYDALRLVKDL